MSCKSKSYNTTYALPLTLTLRPQMSYFWTVLFCKQCIRDVRYLFKLVKSSFQHKKYRHAGHGCLTLFDIFLTSAGFWQLELPSLLRIITSKIPWEGNIFVCCNTLVCKSYPWYLFVSLLSDNKHFNKFLEDTVGKEPSEIADILEKDEVWIVLCHLLRDSPSLFVFCKFTIWCDVSYKSKLCIKIE